MKWNFQKVKDLEINIDSIWSSISGINFELSTCARAEDMLNRFNIAENSYIWKKIADDKFMKIDKEITYLWEETDYKINKNCDSIKFTHYNKDKMDAILIDIWERQEKSIFAVKEYAASKE